MSADSRGTKWHRNIIENFNRLSREHERYRRQTTDDRRQTDRQTDGQATTSFTFAKPLELENYTNWKLRSNRFWRSFTW